MVIIQLLAQKYESTEAAAVAVAAVYNTQYRRKCMNSLFYLAMS
jgi:hypothetical protein